MSQKKCEGNETFDLGFGARGLRMGVLSDFPADPLSGADFLLDVILSRMLVTRACPDEADGFADPVT